MDIRAIQAEDTLGLRKRLLRPHLAEQECVYPGDDAASTTHLGAFCGDDMVGLVSVYREALPAMQDDNGFRFRALAITEAMRGRGYGLALLEAAETIARDNGAGYIWANARVTAKDFYGKVGYAVGTEEFIVEGVGPHVIVSRSLGGM